MITNENLHDELRRLVAEFGASSNPSVKSEAWNLIADFTICNADSITAALALPPGEPDDWQTVPKELTREMREALMMIRQELGSTLMDNADEIYSAFLSWAPKPPAALRALSKDKDHDNA